MNESVQAMSGETIQSRWWWCAPLLLATLMASATLDGQWVYDDRHAVLQSPVVQGTVPASEAWTRDFWGHRLGNASKVSWRPALPLIWRGLWQLGGGDPLPARALSILGHVFATWAFLLLTLALHGRTVALVAGVLFALHPAHAEALGGVVAQADVFAGGLGLLAIALLVRQGARAGPKAVACLALGALFKEVIALYALVCLLWVVAARRQVRPSGLFIGALLVVIAGVVGVQQVAHGGHQEQVTDNVLAGLTFGDRALNGLAITWRGARVGLLPYDVAANHGYGMYSADGAAVLPQALLGLVVLLTSIWLGLRWLARGETARVIWLALGMGPVVAQSHLLFVGPTEFAERLLYTGVGAWCVVIALGGERMLRARPDRARAWFAAVSALCVLAAATSWSAQRPWRSHLALWEHTLEREPLAWRAHHNYGDAMAKSGETQEGLWHLMMAVWLKRRMPKPVSREVIAALTEIEVSERLLMTPNVLSKDDPCSLIDGLLRVAYPGASGAANAKIARGVFAQRYPCARR